MSAETQTVLQQPISAPLTHKLDSPLPVTTTSRVLGDSVGNTLRSSNSNSNSNNHSGRNQLATEDGSSEASSEANSSSLIQQVAVTFQLSGTNFASSAANGLVVVGLPKITEDLALPPSLAFWPASVAALATTSTLLLAGSLADVLGSRTIDLIGCLICGVFMIGCAVSQTGEQLVGLRAIHGVGFAMHLAASVALITKIMPRGRGRNVAFSCLGLSQPLGFSFGLVMGGVFVDTIGWRAAWYIYGGVTLGLFALGFFSLPKSAPLGTLKEVVNGVSEKVDWVGALLASCFTAFLSYFLAILSSNVYKIRSADTIVFLCLGVISLPFFIGWMHRRVRGGKPALIPNAFWKNTAFSSICATIAMSFAVLNSLELFASLFFQEIQHLSALQAAIRILPSLVVGIILNITTGLFVHKIPAVWIVLVSSLLSAGAPVLMAVIQPEWSYWANAFVAQILMPISGDVLFTVGLIVITDVFPEDKQALAGAVFNTGAQFGTALGLAIMQVVSTLVSAEHAGMKPSEALMEGYRASFWTMFAFMLMCAIVGGLGMRKSGKIGLKQD